MVGCQENLNQRWGVFIFKMEKKNKKQMEDLLELAWGLIANANEGDWDKATKEWREAARKWRDTYLK